MMLDPPHGVSSVGNDGKREASVFVRDLQSFAQDLVLQVFFPSTRSSSRIRFAKARICALATTSSSARTASFPPSVMRGNMPAL
jgi:hypothetical protein